LACGEERSVDVEQFRQGPEVQLEHGRRDPARMEDDDPVLTSKSALPGLAAKHGA
jgi:hypothetical protein